MTHEYTLLLGGRVIPGGGAPEATAIAWAADTILAIGSDEEVRSISRGDSHVVDLTGAVVRSPESGPTLEAGGPADLVVEAGRETVVVSRGRVVRGTFDDLHRGAPVPPTNR